MQQLTVDEIVKIQAKGLFTIPKKFREGIFEKNSLARVKKEKGRLIVEPIRTLPYIVRSYTDKEVDEFIDLDKNETKKLKAKGLL